MGNIVASNQMSKVLTARDLNLTTIELANTAKKQAEGLMYRDTLCRECAMLFAYGYPTNLSFWMKNTKISLDIVFLDQNGKVINIHKNTKPLDASIVYRPSAYYWYALETNAGFAEENQLSDDSVIDIQDLLIKSGGLSNSK